MGSVKDPEALDRYRRVLIELSHVTDYIVWEEGALDRLSRHLPGVGTRRIHELMHNHAACNGKIDQVEETREEFMWWKFHYDMRLSILGQRIYIETVLDDHEDVLDCVIHVVNIHPV
jgi:hypothetical protein